jgi:uncharacterized protein YdeI (YjbR/CyaY-like superfamily)
MITEIEDYFTKGCGRCGRFATPDCSVQRWQAGLLALRAICREEGLAEVAKWGHPVYMHAGRNVAIIGAFRKEFRITFMNAGLLADPDGLLERQGPHSTVADALKFRDVAEVEAAVIRSFLRQAMGFAVAGVRADRVVTEPDLPEELVAALDDDAMLAKAWAALTPGRRRSHVLMIAAGKTSVTRAGRVVKQAPRILAGKGANEHDGALIPSLRSVFAAPSDAQPKGSEERSPAGRS